MHGKISIQEHVFIDWFAHLQVSTDCYNTQDPLLGPGDRATIKAEEVPVL